MLDECNTPPAKPDIENGNMLPFSVVIDKSPLLFTDLVAKPGRLNVKLLVEIFTEDLEESKAFISVVAEGKTVVVFSCDQVALNGAFTRWRHLR